MNQILYFINKYFLSQEYSLSGHSRHLLETNQTMYYSIVIIVMDI